ncbi:MAG: alkaline phosphatase family protein, partial [Chloroflexota bacterium]
IANVPHTIAKLLDASIDGLNPLADAKWRPLGGGLKRAVVLIIDGFGANLFHKIDQSQLDFNSEARVTDFITSIFPSTTVAALSSLWTGVGPNQHGLLGLKMFFPEYASAGQMLKFSPVFENFPDALVKAGLHPQTFLSHPGFAQQLKGQDIKTFSFKGREIVHSALSLMHGRGVQQETGVYTFSEMLVNIRNLLEKKDGQTLFVNGYWPTVDTLSHGYTWEHPVVTAELSNLIYLIREELVNKLSHSARKDTALFLVADHGQTCTPINLQIYLEDYPELANMLLMRPIGEPRVGYLFAKQGMKTAVIDYINQNLGYAFVALSSEEAFANQLFGLGVETEQAMQRIGDVVIIAKDGYTLLIEEERAKAARMIGRHGSLTQDEMLVPWLGYRLG